MFAPVGALVANKFGGAITHGAGITMTALLTVLTPLLIDWNLKVYLIARFLEGVFEVPISLLYGNCYIDS